MANALYQKYVARDSGPWVLDWGLYKQIPNQGYLYYAGYTFDSTTGQFTPTGGTFYDTTQDRREGYRLDGTVPVRILTYEDTGMENGANLVYNGTITHLPNRPDRYQKAGLVGTVELPYGSVPEDGVQDGYWYVFLRMATPLWAKAAGVWYPGSGLYGKVAGVWQAEAWLSARVNGIWQ